MSEVYQKLVHHEFSWVNFCYRESEGHWVRLNELMVLKAMQPSMPKSKPTIAPPPMPKSEDHFKWFLYQNDNQTGPYATSELKRLISSGQILEQAHVWRDGFENWTYVKDVKELYSQVAASVGVPPVPTIPSKKLEELKPEKRQMPRKPLVAQVYMTNQSDLSTGICRDISIGGMQLLTDQIPGEVGSQLRINVIPPKDSGMKAFVAEGVIVRVLEDSRGFAFRFTKIDEESKKAIESYIA
jgi:hypothetical protein